MSSFNASNLLRHGVSPSKVGVPANTHLSAIEFLVQRFPGIQREVWLQRFLEGGIFNAKGISIAPNQSVLRETLGMSLMNRHCPSKHRSFFKMSS
jgi:tRNA pseudouridine32 synthase/23S rRNA pseudouridine746 synthase